MRPSVSPAVAALSPERAKAVLEVSVAGAELAPSAKGVVAVVP